MFQTNLHVVFKEQPNSISNPYTYSDVHLDNKYKIENGLLSFELADGEKIIYIPANSIQFFYTTCERVE